MTDFLSGVEAIEHERARQKGVEGFGWNHDGAHTSGELLAAAKAYIDVNEKLDVELPERRRSLLAGIKGMPNTAGTAAVRALVLSMETDPLGWIPCPVGWPWDQNDFKPSEDRKRNLEKAGALIAAEWDRLKRAENAAADAVQH